MKKILVLALVVLMVVSATACGSKDVDDTYSAPTSITVYVESGDTAVPVEVDVSNMSNPFVYNTLIIDLPKGFVADKQTSKDAGIVLAYKGSSTTSTDCYTFDDTGAKQSVKNLDKDEMTDSYKEQFEGFNKFDKFSQTKCSGFDAIYIGFERKIVYAFIFKRQYYIFADNTTYVINYTTEKEKNLNEYEQSLNSIIIK